MRIILVDKNPAVIEAWKDVFSPYNEIEYHEGDYFEHPADAMVSPSNSELIMEGGLDDMIRTHLGFRIEKELQKAVDGYLEIGRSLLLSTDHEEWPYIIAAPTVDQPGDICNAGDVYKAFRAILLVAKENGIESLLCPGLGTGVGKVDPEDCAYQMLEAYLEVGV